MSSRSGKTTSRRSAQHATFVIERTYDAPPARVFAAWAEPKAKAQWFAGTRLVVTEQGAFLDGYDDSGKREQGTGGLLDGLAKFLAKT